MVKDIEDVWRRIALHEGEVFRQVRGGEFRYAVSGNSLRPDRTNRVLGKSQFRLALERMPAEHVASLQDLQGPSYLFAILMDQRIRQLDW